MKLLSSILLLNTIEAGWKQKWEERFGNAVEDKRATERNAACDAKALSETAKFEIQGGSWDCPALGQDVANILCEPKCDDPTDRGNWPRRSFIKVQCRTNPTVKIRNVSNNMQCNPDLCLESTAAVDIPKGQISFSKRNKSKTLFSVTCDGKTGTQAAVICFNSSGALTSKTHDWQNVCDPVLTQTTTEPPTTEFAPLTDSIKSGLETCVSASNFPTGGRKKRERLSKIVGGVNAEEGSWPWITRLFLTESIGGGSGFLCSGSIIHNHWVLSAAHCCDGIAEVVATFGDISRSTFESGQFSLTSTTFFNHPEWGQGADGDFGNSDWCLIKFNEDILAAAPEPEKVKIACLPSEPIEHGSGCWVAGWGTTSSGGSTSTTLLSAGVNILGKDYCENFSNNGILMPDDVCAGLPDNDNNGLTDPGKDACQGDSGGPLICPVDGKAVLAAVVSRGVGCASEGFPGLYSATFNAKDWMRDIILNN
ncbi:Oidioi.mRNA.OKI2018_I69.chr2.g4651.t1.cds [Oikopleura dioica]|uniref:Oidioi.mRNA.OKI2018_I69.chr2.g4651.t1.cds n=1 Tax=Oikopleura dioica TaxID=34765 RepID=A0ABN7T740_OIKDI|nr:Oidioi.mRNA.OKI2018_I69.chr2.g4651.t1.cds [Oikopleura dioica]